jgi:chromate transporter
VLAVTTLLALAAALLGVHELLVLFGAGVALSARQYRRHSQPSVPFAATLTTLLVGGGVAAAPAYTLGGLFLLFAKVGAVLFGSGYVLLAFLRADLVERWHWLSNAQLLDAIAVGQMTPGPVFTTATFIGYVLGGTSGAIAATVGIFLPAFVFVALSGPLLPRLRESTASAFLDGVNVASLALLASVTWTLGGSALVDGVSVGIALVAAALLGSFGINAAWLVLGGGLVGVVLRP